MSHWFYIAVFALVASVAATAETNHQGKGSDILKSPSGRPLIDRNTKSIEKRGPTPTPTEPARELPLDKAPILVCDILTKEKKKLIFEAVTGFEVANLMEEGRDLPVASLKCKPRVAEKGLRSLECADESYTAVFTYAESEKLNIGKFYEVTLGRRSSLSSVIDCRNPDSN